MSVETSNSQSQTLILRINNVYTDIVGGITFPDVFWKSLERTLSFRPEGFQFSPRYNTWIYGTNGVKARRQWDGWKKQFWKNKKRTYFPTGLLSDVKSFLKEQNIPYKVEDCRIRPQPSLNLQLTGNLEEREYQNKAAETACNATRGLISIATGGGKTLLGAKIIAKLNVAPFMFFVTSIDLLLQAKESLEQTLLHNGSHLRVGQIGAGVIDIQDVNVCTIQTAVRAFGKHWNKDYKFDDDDTDDKTPIERYREEIKSAINNAKGSISDECVTGDTLVMTKDGALRIDKLYNYLGKEVLSFGGNSVVWKKITHFYPKGKQEILKIVLSDGKTVRCTRDHPIMTSQGWLPAVNIRPGDQVLCSANAVADNRSLFREGVLADIQNIFSDIKSNVGQEKNGNGFLMNSPQMRHYVSADAANKFGYIPELLNCSSKNKGAEITTDLFTDTINDQMGGIYTYLIQSKKPYLEHSSEIRRWRSRQKEARMPDFIATTGYVSQNGQNLNPHTLADYLHATGNTIMGDMEIVQHLLERAATQNFRAFMKWSIAGKKEKSQYLCLITSDRLDSHGGYAMTEVGDQVQLRCTPKAFQNKKFGSPPSGSPINTGHVAFINIEAITSSISGNRQQNGSSQKLKSISRPVCDTRYVAVESVISCGDEDVFDITVEDTHCFFANGILVHNCQHWKAETCQLICQELKSAYYTYGMSATVFRDSADDMLIQACFGRKIVDINASDLIRAGYLMRPDIKMVHVRNKKCQYKQWQQIYKDQVAENKEYNSMVANIANAYIEQNRYVLVLVKHINHGKELASMIPGALFLSGGSSKQAREAGIKNLRNKRISCICSTVIFDEGINCQSLDTVIMAGQGCSRTRALQRIGRILRPYPGKERATAIDFCIHQKYLEKHAVEREKIYRSEPEFSVEDIDPNGI